MAFHQMTPQNASISPRTRRTFRKSPDPVQRSAAFAACMRGSMSSVRRGDFLFRTKLAPASTWRHTGADPRRLRATFVWPSTLGNPGQVLIQLHEIAATIAGSALATFVLLKVIGLIVPLRVSKESEIDGLDLTQHGEALQ